jgi:hypothetical protein
LRAEEVRNDLAGETNIDRRERLSLRAQNWDARARAQEIQARVDRAYTKDITVKVEKHGELGPVLTNAAHDFHLL